MCCVQAHGHSFCCRSRYAKQHACVPCAHAMAVNPALVQTYEGRLVPAPFANEVFVLTRPKVGFELDGVQTRNGKWSSTGALFLSNVRVVFLADKADASGLQAFDMPLTYIHKDQLNQPIFGCNNLAGSVWPAVEGGGPAGGLPPHHFKVLFKEGGIGTFYPLYYALADRARRADLAARQAATEQPLQQAQQEVAQMVNKAFVDPADPSVIYLTQPAADSQRLNYQPKYAANYGKDEKYEPM